MQRVLRKVPALRALALIHVRRLRDQRARDSAEYVQSVMNMIGTMTVLWAGIERMLDELIAFHQQQMTDLSVEHPVSLSNKLQYLKRMQKDLTYPWGTREFFRRLRIETKRLGNERHEITHGVLRRAGNSLVWKSQRVIYEGPNARVSHRRFHNDDLAQILREIGAHSLHMAPRVATLTGIDMSKFPRGEVEQIHSELLRAEPPV